MAPRKSKAAVAPPENPLSAGPQPTFGDVAELIRTVDEANAVRVAEATGDMLYLRHSQIVADPNNPRTDFDDGALAELADSIAAHGLMQNLVVMAEHDWTGTRHQLIAGERRWRAIGKLFDDGRWDADALIPCKAMAGLDDEARAIQALMENLVRRDLKPLEEARAFKALRDTYGQKTDDIAGKVNRTQRFVQQRLQLLELSPADQKKLDAGDITVEDARRRVANAPKAIDLSEAQALMLAEILHRLTHDPEPGSNIHVEVSRTAADDATLNELKFLGLVSLPSPIWENGLETGRVHLYCCQYDLKHLTKATLPAIAGTPYQTEWLNGPFTVPADLAERFAAEKAERQELSRKRQEEKARRAQALEDLAKAAETLRQCAPDPASALGRILAEQLTQVGGPLPWTVRSDNYWNIVVDANGQRVGYLQFNDNNVQNLLLKLLLIAVNNAGGHATPEAWIEEDPDQDIDGFDPDAEDGDEFEDEDAAELEDA